MLLVNVTCWDNLTSHTLNHTKVFLKANYIFKATPKIRFQVRGVQCGFVQHTQDPLLSYQSLWSPVFTQYSHYIEPS